MKTKKKNSKQMMRRKFIKRAATNIMERRKDAAA